MKAEEILDQLRAQAIPNNVDGMTRFGINPEGTLGIPMPVLRALAKRIGVDHELAAGLWESGIHEARILAALVEDPSRLTSAQMDRWIRDFDSWDVCDQVCCSLFDRSPLAHRKAVQWVARTPEFERRAAFALMAGIAWHDKHAPDVLFRSYLELMERYAFDERNFVKKAVNWALRNIGKRNARLNRAAIAAAKRIARQDSRSARWIAADALRELPSARVKNLGVAGGGKRKG